VISTIKHFALAPSSHLVVGLLVGCLVAWFSLVLSTFPFMGCNTFFLSPCLPSLMKTPHHSFKCQLFFKPSFSCCTKNCVESWVNPNERQSFDHEVDIDRHWVDSNSSSLSSNSKERFTVVSYNILGVKNASKHKHLYPNVPSEYMKWDRRKRLICEELIGWDSDIICLQEVDKYDDILRSLEKESYVGTYKKRTGDSVDGCAMFWKTDRFRLLETENIEFEGFGLRNNVAQISVFEMRKASSRRVLVGNIHVLFNPSRGDIKLGQIQLLLSSAQVLSEKWGGVPIVLVGDFNSTPQGAIYQFLSSSELDVTLHDKRFLSGQRSSPLPQSGGSQGHMSRAVVLMDRFLKNSWTDAEVRNLTGNTNGTIVKHPLRLNSSYASVKVAEGSTRTRDSYGEPLATSFHSKFLGTVDYLWYSEGLVPTRVLDTPPIEILQKTRGLPHKTLGSDHLALVSEFAFA
ncbi:hypothetical protein AQUCO_02600243v1, partial [Aquilegia coerulea]